MATKIVSNAASKGLAPGYARSTPISTPKVSSSSGGASGGGTTTVSKNFMGGDPGLAGGLKATGTTATNNNPAIQPSTISNNATNTNKGLVSNNSVNGLKVIPVSPSSNSQLKTTSIFGDTNIGTSKQIYKGQGLQLGSGEEIRTIGKSQVPLTSAINVYGQKAREAEKLNPGIIQDRNDNIAYNLKVQGAQDKQAISDFLAKQPGFSEGTQIEQQNTINSIANRMGITKEATTPQDQALDIYKQQQDDLMKEGRSQKFVKLMDNLLGENIRPLSDSEITQLASQSGLTTEQAKNVANEWTQARQNQANPYQYKQADLETEKQRAIQDAQTQLERTRQSVSNNIDDITTQLSRDIAGAEKVGALTGKIQSSGYLQGMQNVKDDANKLITRLNQQLTNAETDTAQYITRTNEDFTKNMDRLHTSFTNDMLNLKMASTNEVNGLLTKYSPSDEFLGKELDRINEEYGAKSLAMLQNYNKTSRDIVDTAMYESEKVQQYQTKQKELENLTLSYLFANNGMALRNMSDSEIENLAKTGQISTATVSQLKSARDSANQNFGLDQQKAQLEVAQFGLQQQQFGLNAQKQAYDMGLLDPLNFNTASVTNWGFRNGKATDYGIDYDGSIGQPITSTYSGTILDVGKTSNGSVQVRVKQDDGNVVAYNHCDPKTLQDIKAGTRVNAGDVVGYVGNTGKVVAGKGGDGSHVDIQIKKPDGTHITGKDADTYLKGGPKFSSADINTFNGEKYNPQTDKNQKRVSSYNSFLDYKSQIQSQENPDMLELMEVTRGQKSMDTTTNKNYKDMNVVVDKLSNLSSLIKDERKTIWGGDKLAPIVGMIANNNPWDTKAQAIKAELQGIVPKIARGIFGEVGVLTDTDIKNYIQTLPNIKQTADVQDVVMLSMLDTLKSGLDNGIRQDAATYDVSGMKGSYSKLVNKIDQLRAKVVGDTGTQQGATQNTNNTSGINLGGYTPSFK